MGWGKAVLSGILPGLQAGIANLIRKTYMAIHVLLGGINGDVRATSWDFGWHIFFLLVGFATFYLVVNIGFEIAEIAAEKSINFLVKGLLIVLLFVIFVFIGSVLLPDEEIVTNTQVQNPISNIQDVFPISNVTESNNQTNITPNIVLGY